MKRILSVLLVLAMLVSYVPTYAVAEETTVEDASAVSADEMEKPEAETVADRVEPDETEATDATEVASEATEEATETIPESTTGISETIGTSPTEEKNADKSFVFLNADFQEEDQTYHYTVEANVGDIVVLCADLEYNGEKPLQYQWMRFDIDRNAYIDISLEENEDARSEKLTVNVTEAMIEMEAPYACKVTLDQTEELAVFSIVPLEATGDDTLVDEIFALDAVPDSSDEGWLWPVPDNRTIYSPFNLGNDYLINKRGSTHWGIDIARNADLSIVASRTGVVAFVQNSGYNDTSGKNQSASTCRLVLQHNINGKTFFSYYLHIKSGTIRYYSNINGHKAGDVISVGDTIPQGTVIGITGNTGLAYGTHLHFGLSTKHSGGWVSNGTYINPNPTNSGVITSNNKGQYSNTDILGYSSNYGDGIEYVIPGSTVTAPAAPTNFKAVYVDNARAKLSWSASSGATSYEVQYWSVGSNAWKTDTSYSSGTSYTSTGLKNYSSWTFRVRAVNSAGKSDWVSCNYEKTHTHSYKQEFEAAHPHKVYMKCTSCGDWYYTGATTTVDSCTQCHPPVQQVYLDLKGYLDGRDSDSLENFGTCDVYINDVKVADDCTDFYQSYPVGTKYSIEDIRATDGYTYLGEKGTSDASDGSVTMPFSALGGTLEKNTEVILEFKTADSGTCGDNLTWGLSEDGTLVIYGKGEMKDYVAVYDSTAEKWVSSAPWAGCSPKKIEIRNGITRIGNCAFYGCSDLTGTLSLPDSLKAVGNSAFEGCTGLSGRLLLPDRVESVGESAFRRCTGFDGKLVLPGNLVEIGSGAFAYCSGLSGELDIPGKIKNIGSGAFILCEGFTGKLTLYEGVQKICFRAFYGCTGIESIMAPESLSVIEDSAFERCSSLKDVYYSGTQTQWNLISVGNANEPLVNAGIHCDPYAPVASGTCGENLTWSLDGYGTLIISGSGDMQDFGADDSNAAPWSGKNPTKLVLSDDIISVGDYAFYKCSSITGKLTLPSRLRKIGKWAFDGCSGFTGNLALPQTLTEIRAGAFDRCSGFTGDLILPEEMEEIRAFVFNECKGFNGSLRLPQNIKIIDANAFRGCDNLTGKLELPATLTEIGGVAFAGCNFTGGLRIPGSVSSIGASAFHYCRGFSGTLEFSEGNTTIVGYSFSGCDGFTDVILPVSITNIGIAAFRNMTGLQNVYYGGSAQQWNEIEIGDYNDDLTNATIHYASTHIHDMVKTEAVEPTYWSVGNNAYYTCSRCGKVFKDANGETETTVEDETLAILPSIAHGTCGNEGDNLIWVLTEDGTLTISGSGEMESYDRIYQSTTAPWGEHRGQITAAVLRPGVTSIGKEAFYDCGSLTSVAIPDGVTSIGNDAFCNCGRLTSVTIPDSVASIGLLAFQNCSSLTSVKIPDSVTSIGGAAFIRCKGLTSIIIPAGITRIADGTFEECTSLTSVKIPDGVMSIGEDAFRWCSSLTSVMIPSGVMSIGNSAFLYCSNLTSVKIPDGVTNIGRHAFCGCSKLTNMTIPEGVTSINDYTFWGCSNLTSVTIPDSVTSLGYAAFCGCSSLTDVTIPKGVTSIGERAFWSCNKLTNMAIPEGVTSIGEGGFCNCSSLTSVTIPESVVSIGDNAFADCSKLEDVYYGGPDHQWKKIVIGVNNDALTNATIHYASTHAHNVEHVPGKASGCTETGNLEYWRCSICGEYFTDETFTKSTDEAGVTLPALGHALTRKEAVKPTHKTAGNIEYYICSRCGKLFKDALGTEETTLEEVTLLVIPYVSKIILTRGGEPIPDTMEVDGRTGDTLTFVAVVQPEGAETKVKWSSGTPAVAQVDQDGIVTLLTSGTTVIKAAATDGSRVTAQVTLNVTARDYAPRLGASALTLNSVSFAGVSVDLVESYGNQILSVSVDDERFDAEYADNLLTLTSREAVARGTYRMTLEAVCDDGRTYSYPITVRVIQTLPRLTVRQSQRFNLFYRDSQATLTITGGEIESAAFIGNSDFALENENGQWFIRYADPENIPAKPGTKVTLSVLFAGYNTPVTKSVTIATVNTSPKLKLSPSSSVLNTVLTEALEVRAQLAGTDDDNLSVWTDTPGAEVYLDDGTLTIGLSAAKAVTVNVYVQSDSWAKPVKLTHKVSVTTKKPTLKAINSTLKLNSYFPSETASTGLILSQGNLSLSMVELTSTAKAGAAATESEKLSVSYDLDSEEIVAEILDSSIKNGTYSFTCVGTLEDGTAISGGTVKVSVTNTLPKAKLSASTVKLNKRLTGEEATVKVSLTGGNGYTVTGFENLPDFMWYEDGILTVTLPEQSGTYPLYATVSRGGEEAVLPTAVKLTVQVYDKVPSFRLSAKGKLDVLDPDSKIIYTPKLTNALGTATDVELTGANADLFDAEVVNGTIHLTLAKSGDNYSTKATYKIVPLLTICDQQVKGPALSIKVTQSALKLASLPNRTVYTSQATPLVQTLHVTAPAAAEIGDVTLNSKTSAALRSALDTAGGLQSRGATIAFPAKAFAGLKPGNYTVILDITPVNAASDSKPAQAKFTLTVKK